MFCKECGAQIDDDSKFCIHCGCKIKVEKAIIENLVDSEHEKNYVCNENVAEKEEGVVISDTEQIGEGEVDTTKSDSIKRHINKKIFMFAICGVVLLAIFLVLILSNKKTKVKLNDYILISCEGYNGYADIEVNFDYTQFKKDYGNKIKINFKEVESFGDPVFSKIVQYDPPTDTLLEFCVSYSADNEEMLTNGDIITIAWDCEDGVADIIYDCKLIYSDIEYKVENLKEAEKYDAFENLEITYEGIDGEGKLSLSNTEDGLNYEISKRTELSNGDEVVISIESNDFTSFINRTGKAPEAFDKSYIVEGLGRKKLSESDFNDDFIDALDKAGKYEAEEYVKDLCAAKERDLMNKIDLISGIVGGEITSEPELLQINVGNSKNGSDNTVLLSYKVPYKATITSDPTGETGVGKVVGEGITYIVVQYNNAINYDNSDNFIGRYENHGYRNTKEEINNIYQQFADNYDFFNVTPSTHVTEEKSKEISSSEIDELLIAKLYEEFFEVPEEEGYLPIEAGKLEYALIDMNNDGINELIPRTYGTWIPGVFCYSDGNVNYFDCTNCGSTSIGWTYINNNNQYVAGINNETDHEEYYVSEIDQDGNVHAIIGFVQQYDYDNDVTEYFKMDNPTSSQLPLYECEEISEEEYRALVNQYSEENKNIKWITY